MKREEICRTGGAQPCLVRGSGEQMSTARVQTVGGGMGRLEIFSSKEKTTISKKARHANEVRKNYRTIT